MKESDPLLTPGEATAATFGLIFGVAALLALVFSSTLAAILIVLSCGLMAFAARRFER